MDYVKTIIQAESYTAPTPWRKHPILLDGGFFDCWKKTVKKHGFWSLWRGFGPCVARAFPANAGKLRALSRWAMIAMLCYSLTAGFLAYEGTLRAIRKYEESSSF